jgi:hypothetical protein
MLDAAIMVESVRDHDDGNRGQELDHRLSRCRDSASSLTPPEEHGRRCDRDDRNMCDVIHDRDARCWIENRRQDQEHIDQEQRDEMDNNYYGPFYDQPHQQRSPERGCNAEGVKAFSHDLKRVCWPLNFKPSGIKKFDGSTNPAEWVEVYQLSIKAVDGDSYIMASYLPVCLSSSARTWLLGLPLGSVPSWSHLYRQFTSNFCAICTHPGVDWDLSSIV